MSVWMRILHKIKRVATFSMLHFQALKHGRNLRLVQDNLESIQAGDILLFSVMKNESHRLDYFTEYYRQRGVNHFVFVDNDSDEGLHHRLRQQKDISVFHTKASYRDSNFGVHWLNYLLSKMGTGHWCLTCDPDEFLVYPMDDTRNLAELTAYLDTMTYSSMYTLLIDMYSDTTVEESKCKSGQNPLDICPYFDRRGYTKNQWDYYSAVSANGGVRHRVFFSDCPDRSPAINKVPLVKWKWHFRYALSTHVARPNFINEVCDEKHVTGALLHFKFISELSEKIEEEMRAKQHWDNSFEYQKYDETLRGSPILYEPDISVRFEDWRTLVGLGLANMADW